MADAKPNVKAGMKTPPKKFLIPAVVIVGAGGLLYLKKKKASEESTPTNATGPASEGLTNQSFIPVTGEGGGVGAGGGGSVGGSGTTGSNEDNTLFKELLQGNRESAVEQDRTNKEWLTTLLGTLGTGGGLNTEPVHGVVVTPPQGGATPSPPSPSPGPTPAPPKTPPPSSGDPIVATIKCGNGCQGHKHKSGRVECQVKNAKHQCVWP